MVLPKELIEVTSQQLPQWLKVARIKDKLPIAQMLKNSLYYPSSGRDGDPVKYLSGLVHSFVYVDYSVSKQDLMESLNHVQRSFLGYNISGIRDIDRTELVPYGWKPQFIKERDGNPDRYSSAHVDPYALWILLDRDSSYDEKHGPKRLSLLYIAGDGVASYQAIYGGNNISPRVLAIICPGHNFGLNWTNYEDENELLGRSVLHGEFGVPEFLLYGYYSDARVLDERKSCWKDYNIELCKWRAGNVWLSLWKRGPRTLFD